jgi:hypothetical protein
MVKLKMSLGEEDEIVSASAVPSQRMGMITSGKPPKVKQHKMMKMGINSLKLKEVLEKSLLLLN